jgi:hypothetical protein
VVIIHNLFSQFWQYPNMKVQNLQHPFILQAIVASFGFFLAFLLLKVKILTEHSVLKMVKFSTKKITD